MTAAIRSVPRWRRVFFGTGVMALAVVVLGLAAGCDRTTKKGLGADAEPDIGPHNVPGGVLFAFFAPDAQTVHLAGSFNNWSTSADPMQRDAAGRWTIRKALPAGTHQYKFVVNGGAQWKEDPMNPQSTDDGYGGKNSLLDVDAGGKVAAAGTAAAPLPASSTTTAGEKPIPTGGPKKTDDGWLFAIDLPNAGTVHLAGTFNSWSTSADPMSKDAKGRWSIVKALGAGTHQYKFVIDGGAQWKEDPANPNTTDDGYGGKNSVLVVP
jgi:1,4-alpha-glucan branching enzyme